jgi:defect-in-organelle-trafficking protein DotA
MQIFVMWVVVQGIGAADKVWNAALSYLNQGGAIVQPQMSASVSLLAGGSGSSQGAVAKGAQAMLAGEVCMQALQNQLQARQKAYKASTSSVCSSATSGSELSNFCNSSIPNFISSVSFVDIQNDAFVPDGSDSMSLSAPMPNFTSEADPTGLYSQFNGICGTIRWNTFSKSSQSAIQSIGLQDSDVTAASNTRVVAMQQMYLDLQSLAQQMVNNDPALAQTTTQNNSSSTSATVTAVQEFGVPKTATSSFCENAATPSCILWGSLTTGSSPLLTGTAFSNAITDYNAIMLPTLTLLQEAQNASVASDARSFISTAEQSGWLMAGSYFFDLVSLNVQANLGTEGSSLTDTDTGLDKSTSFNSNNLLSCFLTKGGGSLYPLMCKLFGSANRDLITPITLLINASGSTYTTIITPDLGNNRSTRKVLGTPVSDSKYTDPIYASTVYGYTNNSSMVQPLSAETLSTSTVSTAANISFSTDTTPYEMQPMDFTCDDWNTLSASCIASTMAGVLYNDIFVTIYNAFLGVMFDFFINIIDLFLQIPLSAMFYIFADGLAIIDNPSANPVVALAQMGTYYINFAADLYLQIIAAGVFASFLGIFGLFIFAVLMLVMPIILAWMGVMLTIGYSTAYYAPLLPYLLFTFGAIAWVMAVIEAMVAAPIVALGVSHPEGHDAFGKGEAAIMILMNVFLRPTLMIIGFISGIAMTYVSVWILNAGYDHAILFMQGGTGTTASGSSVVSTQTVISGVGTVSGGYVGWAGFFASFFAILIYTTSYLTVVQKSFTLIATLPDKVLRWIGGQAESAGQESSQWAGDVKKEVDTASKETSSGQAQMDKQVGGNLSKLGGQMSQKASQSGGGQAQAQGGGGSQGGGSQGGGSSPE